MPHETHPCHRERARAGDSHGKSTTPDTLIRVDAAHQWAATTLGRTATDPYSWMQAVHWVGGSGLYKPSRTHGPGWGPTTVMVAQEIAALKECRPGIDYLARKLKASERTIQYHLGMLREAGLLAYRIKGTRCSGLPNQASQFERIIPPEFDTALGIRTTGTGVQRRPVGIAPESQTLIGKLAKKAARRVRRTRSKRTPSGGSLCTPMQVGTSGSSTTGSTSLPPETSKLASGQAESPTPKSSKRGPKKLNRIGRRHQLARELIQLVPWLGNAHTARIAWIVRDVADAGWTADEVRAAIDVLAIADTVHRPSGYLARRLEGVHDLWNTPARREQLVADWRDSKHAAAARHAQYETQQDGPSSPHVRKLVSDAMNRVRDDAFGTDLPEILADTAIDLEALDRATIVACREAAKADPGIVTSALATGMTERDARRLYTNQHVDRALKTYTTHIAIHA